MVKQLKSTKIRGHNLKFYKGKNGWVRTHIKKNGELISSFDSKNKTIALKKSRKFLKSETRKGKR